MRLVKLLTLSIKLRTFEKKTSEVNIQELPSLASACELFLFRNS